MRLVEFQHGTLFQLPDSQEYSYWFVGFHEQRGMAFAVRIHQSGAALVMHLNSKQLSTATLAKLNTPDLRKWPQKQLFNVLGQEAEALSYLITVEIFKVSTTKSSTKKQGLLTEYRKILLKLSGTGAVQGNKLEQKSIEQVLKDRTAVLSKIIVPRFPSRTARRRARQRLAPQLTTRPAFCNELRLGPADKTIEGFNCSAEFLASDLARIAKASTGSTNEAFGSWRKHNVPQTGGGAVRLGAPLGFYTYADEEQDCLNHICRWLQIKSPEVYKLRQEKDGYYLPNASEEDTAWYRNPPGWPETYNGRLRAAPELHALKGDISPTYGQRYQEWLNSQPAGQQWNTNLCNSDNHYQNPEHRCGDCARIRYKHWWGS